MVVFFFQAEDGIRDYKVTGVQTCALPISVTRPYLIHAMSILRKRSTASLGPKSSSSNSWRTRSEEHTSELQSPCNLVCRLLLEKKKNTAKLAPSTFDDAMT